jgi:hypothetical protein
VKSSRRQLFALGIAALAFAPGITAAQEVEESDVQIWTQYQYQQRISEKLRGSWDLGYRELVSTEDKLGEWSRFHLRGHVVYERSERVSFEGGVGGFYTFREDPADLAELRAWQGVIVFWPRITFARRQFDLRHRFRFEQRWFRQRDAESTEFSLRLRYRLATFIPLTKRSIEDKALFLPLMGEWFGDVGDDSSEFFAARLRLSTGLGYVLSNNWTLEFRYTAQKSRDTVEDRFTTTDHIFDFRLRTTIRIRDLGRAQ